METIKVKEAAKRLGLSEQAIRIMLQRKLLPFGVAIPNSKGTGFRYIIPRKAFEDFLGTTEGK